MKRLLPAFVLSLLLLICIPAASYGGPLIGPKIFVNTQPATDITPYSAILHATIIWPSSAMNNQTGNIRPASHNSDLYGQAPIIPASRGYFRYGTTPGALTSSTPPQVLRLGATGFAADALSLYPCTTYYFQAVVIASAVPIDYEPSISNYLIALTTIDGNMLQSGLGIGLNRLLPDTSLYFVDHQEAVITGAILSFRTTGCVPNIGSHNASSTGPGGTVGLSNIAVHTATISSTKVAPGEKVDITAMVTNSGSVNGESKVTLYINGAQVESKGVTLASGQSTPVHFYVSENEPGTYNVHVGGVSAGSFTVDAFANNDILIYGVIALFTIGIAGTIFMLTRKRPV